MIRVLIADDETMIRTAMETLLGMEDDIEILPGVADGRAAVQAAQELQPDVCILDLEMPELDGVEAAQEIARTVATKVIICTRHARPGVLRRALAEKVAGFVPKSTPVERLVWLRFARKQYIAGIGKLISFLRKNHPGVKISSCVGSTFPFAFGYDAFFGRFDWVTTQTQWGGGPTRQKTGFLTKYLTDISGTPAAPCVHIEAYFVSLDPADTRDVLSQVFRAGGNSFQLALFDWFGNSQSDLFGAPDRFYEVMHVLRQLPRMNKLKYPEADCAIFSSNMEKLAVHYFSQETDRSGLEELFTMLGPHNRSWFHFITEEN